MTPQKFKEEIQKIIDNDKDIERVHIRMDMLMCTILIDLGYKEGVEIFNNQRKWYA